MPTNYNRLKSLAGIETADEVVSPEDQDRLDAEADQQSDRQYQLQKQARTIVLRVCRRVGIEALPNESDDASDDDDGASYEIYIDDDGECTVSIESCSLDSLIKLNGSGVGSNFTLSCSKELTIVFQLSNAILTGNAKL